jgi:hypothetical protein
LGGELIQGAEGGLELLGRFHRFEANVLDALGKLFLTGLRG